MFTCFFVGGMLFMSTGNDAVNIGATFEIERDAGSSKMGFYAPRTESIMIVPPDKTTEQILMECEQQAISKIEAKEGF